MIPTPTPNQDRIDDVEWHYEMGGSFWSFVDSRPSAYSMYRCGREGCDREYGDPECHTWEHRRGEMQCVALKSDRERCAQWVLKGTPFCDFHFRRAWNALYAAASADMRVSFDSIKVRMAARFDAEVEKRVAIELRRFYEERERPEPRPEFVYFFVCDHAVKIGTSINPRVRVKSFGRSTIVPEDVDLATGRLVGTISGGSRVEHDLHRRFAAHRLAGEWFTYEPIRADLDCLLLEQGVDATSGAA